MKNLIAFLILINLFVSVLFSFERLEREASSSGFSSSIFDKWLLVASFDKYNVPSFKFVSSDDKNWKESNLDIEEYSYNGDNTKAGLFSIYNMKYYQYRGYNPLYTKSQNKNNSKMIKRFYFYRFSGKGAGFISLDNSLVAVDTQSKYVYIYGVPIRDRSILGNDVPLEWGASDTNGMPFYKYDPIGRVNEDGSVILYEQYRTSFLDKKKRYLPTFNGKSIYR